MKKYLKPLVVGLVFVATTVNTTKAAEEKSDINQTDEDGYTQLHRALLDGNHDTALSLLTTAGIDVNLATPPYTYDSDHPRRGGQTRPPLSPLLLAARQADENAWKDDEDGQQWVELTIFQKLLTMATLPTSEELEKVKDYYSPSSSSYVYHLLESEMKNPQSE